MPVFTTQMEYYDFPRDDGKLYIAKFPSGEFPDPQGEMR